MDSERSRRLVWVPIIHSQEDLGRLREAVRQQHTERHGGEHWDRHVQAVAAFWQEVRRRVADLKLEPGRTRLYQDGLPVCPQAGAIVADLAQAGSENHQLLSELAAAGATIEGTESPELLLLEYQLALKALGAGGAAVGAATAEEFARIGKELLQRRDRFIAERIAQTLQPGETGLLFLGLLHEPGPYFPVDVRLVRMAIAGPTPVDRSTQATSLSTGS